MNPLTQWMKRTPSRQRRTGPKLEGLSYAEAARILSDELGRHISHDMVYNWCRREKCSIPGDVAGFVNGD